MHAFTVQVIDAARVFHAYIQLAESRAHAEDIAFERFGLLRLLSVRRAS